VPLPAPELDTVISYSYLWSSEADEGQEEERLRQVIQRFEAIVAARRLRALRRSE
jgi:hypothetical protein